MNMKNVDGAILIYALRYVLNDSIYTIEKFTELVKEHLDGLDYGDLLLFGRLCEQAEKRQFFHPSVEGAAEAQARYCKAVRKLKQVFTLEIARRGAGD